MLARWITVVKILEGELTFDILSPAPFPYKLLRNIFGGDCDVISFLHHQWPWDYEKFWKPPWPQSLPIILDDFHHLSFFTFLVLLSSCSCSAKIWLRFCNLLCPASISLMALSTNFHAEEDTNLELLEQRKTTNLCSSQVYRGLNQPLMQETHSSTTQE